MSKLKTQSVSAKRTNYGKGEKKKREGQKRKSSAKGHKGGVYTKEGSWVLQTGIGDKRSGEKKGSKLKVLGEGKTRGQSPK